MVKAMPMIRLKKTHGIFRLAMLLFLTLAENGPALAHPLAPSLLQITETDEGFSEVLWKIPAARIPGETLRPQIPPGCRRSGDMEVQRVEAAHVERWRISCDTSWIGSEVGIEGIAGSISNVILRIQLADGRKYQSVLNAENPRFIIPQHPPMALVFKNYLALGMKHILTGWDHLLFVLGLMLLVKGRNRLLWTITAFTLGHSVTLSLAALFWIHVPPAPVEALITLSILVLAVELTRKQAGGGTFFHRYPWSLAFAFGLLHGLGFAGALAEVGLPVGEIPLALFSFNLGIEAGQLLFIFALLVVQLLVKPLSLPSGIKRVKIPAYGIGSLAAFWFFERLWNFI
jgi:hydrogenase/urease accessory protein HupE